MEPGEVRRTKLPDAVEGIRQTVARMGTLIIEGSRDPLVITTARKIAALSSPDCVSNPLRVKLCLQGIHAWCRANWAYVGDPVGVEFLQTPNRMLRELAIPEILQKAVWEPISQEILSPMPLPKITGDADEATILVLALAGAIGIEPLRIRVGGEKSVIRTCWGAAEVDGVWKDLDLLVPSFGARQECDLIEEFPVDFP